jgi:hypothetical protein
VVVALYKDMEQLVDAIIVSDCWIPHPLVLLIPL